MAGLSGKGNALRFGRRAVYCLPGPGKESRGGEDAFFCTSQSLGIADGVGSWEAEGVDPSLYPRKLMSAALQASAMPRKQLDQISEFPPLAILDRAYKEAAATRLMGSCTAVVSAMIDDHRFGVLNVGDSGLRILRDGKLFFGTTELQWRFNCPHQLGPTSRDTPSGGERSILTLHEGDVIVLGTDGLFDNVFDEDIVRIASPLGVQYLKQKKEAVAAAAARNASTTTAAATAVASSSSNNDDSNNNSNNSNSTVDHKKDESSQPLTASHVAEELARYAKSLSLARSGVSPFAKNAAAAGHFYQGGKPDDITVVVAIAQQVVPNNVVSRESSEQTTDAVAARVGGGDKDSNDDGVAVDAVVNEEKCPLLVEEFFQSRKMAGGWNSRL